MNLTTVGYLWCLLAAVASAGATVLIKISGQQGSGISLSRLLFLGGAGGAYALGFICYALALEKLQISLAYPVMTVITLVLVTMLGCFVLQESMTVSKLLGIALISTGAFVLSR